MNTKFKKTALEDDAEIYQHGTKSATKSSARKTPRVHIINQEVSHHEENYDSRSWHLPGSFN